MGLLDTLGIMKKTDFEKTINQYDKTIRNYSDRMSSMSSALDNYKSNNLKMVKQLNEFMNKETTPYGSTSDQILDLLQYYASKFENYNFADMSKNIPVVRAIQNKIVFEVVKNGFRVKSKFNKKCSNCGLETNSEVTECEACNGNAFKIPNIEQYNKLNKLLEDCNVNNTSLKQEVSSFVLDATRYDEGFFLIMYDFYLKDGLMLYDFNAIQRVVPMNFYTNISQYGVLGVSNTGQAQGFCPMHRDAGIQDLKQTSICLLCLRDYNIENPLWTADYYQTMGESNKTRIWYNRREVIRYPLFEKSSRYSPLISLYPKATSLLAIDELINDIYVLRKIPNRALFIKTNDIEGIKESDEYNKIELAKNKFYTAKYTIGAEAEGEFVKIVDMLGTIDELKLIDLQNKYEKDIAQFYNAVIDEVTRKVIVEPDFIKHIQNDINDLVLKPMLKRAEITDWDLTLRPSQLSDEANELRLEGLKIQNALGKINLGFELTRYDTENKEFIFKDEPTEPAGQSSFSSFSSNARGLENTFGNLPGTDDLGE